MKLQVRPVYGWGWYNIKGDAVDVPAPFEFDATIIEPDNPDELFTVASGHLDDAQHPLSGLWIFLSQRHGPGDGCCNLCAFRDKPALPLRSDACAAQPGITGFAEVQEARLE
jgi:hypothetical protein